MLCRCMEHPDQKSAISGQHAAGCRNRLLRISLADLRDRTALILFTVILRQPTDERPSEQVFGGITAELSNAISDVAKPAEIGHCVCSGQLIERSLKIVFVELKPANPGEFEEHLQIWISFVTKSMPQPEPAGFGHHLQGCRHKVVNMGAVKQGTATSKRGLQVRAFDIQQAARLQQAADALKCGARGTQVFNHMHKQHRVTAAVLGQFVERIHTNIGIQSSSGEFQKLFPGIDSFSSEAGVFEDPDRTANTGSNFKQAAVWRKKRGQPTMDPLTILPRPHNSPCTGRMFSVIGPAVVGGIEGCQFGFGGNDGVTHQSAAFAGHGGKWLSPAISVGKFVEIRTAAQVTR